MLTKSIYSLQTVQEKQKKDASPFLIHGKLRITWLLNVMMNIDELLDLSWGDSLSPVYKHQNETSVPRQENCLKSIASCFICSFAVQLISCNKVAPS